MSARELAERLTDAYATVRPLEAEVNDLISDFVEKVIDFYRQHPDFGDEGTYAWATAPEGWDNLSARHVTNAGFYVPYFEGTLGMRAYITFNDVDNIEALLKADYEATIRDRADTKAALQIFDQN